MRAILKTQSGVGAKFVDDFPKPSITSPHDVIINVKAASVCGSDKMTYFWRGDISAPRSGFPWVLGHEGAGVVEAVGSEVSKVGPGDRVALESHASCGQCYMCLTGNSHNCENMRLLGTDINGVFAEQTCVPEDVVFRIPDDMTYNTAALLEPAGVGWHAVQRAGKDFAGKIVVVSGCGPIGLFIIKMARICGASAILAIEPNSKRRRLAEQFGARTFEPGNAIMSFVSSQHQAKGGVDVVFEASGARAAFTNLFGLLRRGGELITVGQTAAPVDVEIARYINKREIVIKGVFGRLKWSTWTELVDVIRNGQLIIEDMVTEVRSLDDLGETMRLLDDGANKIIYNPERAEKK